MRHPITHSEICRDAQTDGQMDYGEKDVDILIYDVIDFARLTRLWYQVCTQLGE